MITAEQARWLYQPSIDEVLEQAEKAIKQAAKTKRHVYLHGDFWAREGYRNTPRYQEVKIKLEELGYKVSFFYEDRQFATMYTVVEW